MSVENQSETIKLASIVSIDVAGFSTMSERDQRRAARAVETLRTRIEAVAAANGGRIFNTAGDGFMLEFGSAGSALGAIQDLLDKRPKGEPAIRVGAHVGDVIVTINNDLLGHGVNVAARLQSLAAPGGALVSGEFRSMAHSSPTAAFQSRGRQPLDNIDQRVHTFEILSKRQKFARVARRVGLIVGVLLLVGLTAFVTPFALDFARRQGWMPGGEPEAAASTPLPVAAEEVVAVVAAPAEPAAPQHAPGDVIKDCDFCPELVVLPGGTFQMGSPASETGRFANEGPQREVTIAPFAVSKTEVTFGQWDACLASGGCRGFSPPDNGFGRGAHPVLGVSWSDARAYVDWLNSRSDGPDYRLLSEAEWEYAARAGTTTRYATGGQIRRADAVFGARAPAEAGQHAANAFGLHDVTGNVWEWVEDCYAQTYAGAPTDGSAVSPARCAQRAYRGGGYRDPAAALRVANRRRAGPDVRDVTIGFRVARNLD